MKVSLGKFPRKNNNRKVNVTIDGYDTWNLDHTLALIIYPALVQLRNTKHGIPNQFGDVGGEKHHSQQSFDFYEESTDEAFNEGVKRWEETLDKMIWSFEQLLKGDYDEQYHHGHAEYDWVKSDKTFPNPLTGKVEETFQMVDKNPENHWYDYEGHQLHEERIQEGLDLFAKYYRNLWD
jgi:hypothetical protein